MRTTVLQAKYSRIPESLGLCNTDTLGLCSYINEATQRLIIAGGDTGWWGTWWRVAYELDVDDPYIILGRNIARLSGLAVSTTPLRIQGEFYEFLEAGIGPQPNEYQSGALEAIERGISPTMVTLTTTNQKLRVYPANSNDVGKRIFFKCKDQNGLDVYTMESGDNVHGLYLSLESPFVESPFIVTEIESVYKDVTVGDVVLYQVDDTTGDEVLLSRYAPDETTPSYRKYLVNKINSCQNCDTVTLTAMAKLEYVPVSKDSDFLLIGNLPALKEACLAIKFGEMDSTNAETMSRAKWQNAIKLLNRELEHYRGVREPTVNFAPMGTYLMSTRKIGALI